VKARYLDPQSARPRADPVIGTPITNTLGEMYTLLRFQAPEALRDGACMSSMLGFRLRRHQHRTGVAAERRLQAGDPLRCVHQRRRPDDDVPLDRGRGAEDRPARPAHAAAHSAPANASWFTAEASPALQGLSATSRAADLGDRIPQGQGAEGDDILLSVITDGGHAAIDMRLVWHATTTNRRTSSTS